MTELIIDGTHAVLPKDFSVSVKRENPLFTKNGEYTYDITLQLSNPTNASLYEHLNRLTSVTEVRSERSAVLIADNRVYCNGTEVITAWTDDTVSIQIASGNSELNYVIGGDRMISSLEMKETVPATGDYSPNEKIYPDTEYNLAPVYSDTENRVLNQWNFFHNTDEAPQWIVDGVYIPQPYLCAYIRELLRGLGYTLTENSLEGTVFKDLYLCHTQHTYKWSEMLPGWSVLDFLEQIEITFNMVFVIDARTRSVRLLFRNEFFSGVTTLHVLQVKDEYEAEVEEEPDVEDAASSDVAYNLGSDNFWKYACLNDAIRQAAKYDTIPVEYEATDIDRISRWFREEEHARTDTIYTDAATGRKYLYMGNVFEEISKWPVYVMVDQFAGLKRDEPVGEVTSEIVPASLVQTQTYKYASGSVVYSYTVWIPSPDDANSSSENENEMSLVDMIENGVTETEDNSTSKNTMALAFYTGDMKIEYKGSGSSVVAAERVRYPVPYIDEYAILPVSGTEQRRRYYKTNTVGASLRLQKLDELCYQGSYDIDYHREITIESYDPNVYDPRMIFEIANRRYVCKEMEYTLDANGRKGPWKGIFCRINISDTEADARWILSDGKWRDGGVWLDNGRWLDE